MRSLRICYATPGIQNVARCFMCHEAPVIDDMALAVNIFTVFGDCHFVKASFAARVSHVAV